MTGSGTRRARHAIAACGLGLALALSRPGAALAAGPADGIIDVHFHAHPQTRESGAGDFDIDGAARLALEVMDAHGIALAVVMPPPMPHGRRSAYDYPELKRLVAAHPGRFAFFGGGGTLNGMIQEADPAAVTAAQRAAFAHAARAILAAGARGFGELTALHLSFRPGHPFEVAPPDHPLFLLLADIAAERGVPIDLHMEAVAHERPTPPPLRARGEGNPERLGENIAALERLLAHNRKAPILWSHLGWDNTGQRGPRLTRRLLAAHSNLYMSVKVWGQRVQPRQGGKAAGGGGGGAGRNAPGNPVRPDGTVKPQWLALFEAFPDRFLIGSDCHVYASGRYPSRVEAAASAAFLRALPAPVARAIGRDNARRLLRLP